MELESAVKKDGQMKRAMLARRPEGVFINPFEHGGL
jgi:hypothetical protein